MTRIHNWYTRADSARSENRYRAPEQDPGFHLVGEVYGHPKRRDGDVIASTTIVSAAGRTVTTESGNVYALGRPKPTWLKWLKANGMVYDSKQPVKILKAAA